MKRMRIIITASLLLAFNSVSYALDVSAGLTTWYAYWLPEFEDSFRGENNAITANDTAHNTGAINDSFSVEPCIMAGPVLSLKFTEHWSLGLVFLASLESRAEGSYDVFHDDDYAGWDLTYTQWTGINFRRYDSDLTLAYRLNSMLGVFAGFKCLMWYGDGEGGVDTSGSVNYSYTSRTSIDITGRSLGPALGINIVIPFLDMFFFTASGSGLYLRTYGEQRYTLSENGGPGVTSSIEDSDNFRGFNTAAGLGCYIDSISSTLIIGGRYQYIQAGEDKSDIFYGATLSVMYSF